MPSLVNTVTRDRSVGFCENGFPLGIPGFCFAKVPDHNGSEKSEPIINLTSSSWQTISTAKLFFLIWFYSSKEYIQSRMCFIQRGREAAKSHSTWV